jgi:hypothetical protein
MTILEETQAGMTELATIVADIDVKLDEVRTFISTLIAGQGATPEQLQQLLDTVNTVKTHATGVLAEADALDEPAA